eukprot:gene18194-23855_t
MKKFPITRLQNSFSIPLPQCVIGRIVPSSNIFQAPISGKPCVYYHVIVRRLQIKGSLLRWVDEVTETRSSNFKLEDNFCPDKVIEVNCDKEYDNLETISIKRFSVAKENTDFNLSSCFPSDLPNYVKAFLERNDIDLESAGCMGRPSDNLQFIEFRYDIGQKLAILGIIHKKEQQENVFEILPITSTSLSLAYFSDNSWTEKQNVDIGVLQPDLYKEFFDPKDSLPVLATNAEIEESKYDYNSNFGVARTSSADMALNSNGTIENDKKVVETKTDEQKEQIIPKAVVEQYSM